MAGVSSRSGNRRDFLLKQIGMGSGSLQTKFVSQNFIDQQPIRLDMAISMFNPIPPKLVILIPQSESLACEEKIHDRFDLGEVFAAFLQTLDILLKLMRLRYPHWSQDA